jgi:hypothetical protein
MTQTENKQQDLVVRLFATQKVNAPWLENQAIKIEDALNGRFPDVPEPSVTANFAENGFELDLIIEADTMADAYNRLGEILKVVEETAGIELGGDDEVRSDYASASSDDDDHDFSNLSPAPAC